jgi:transposase
MGWQPTRLTGNQLEERRLAAARLLRTHRRSEAEIAREMGVSRTSVTRWKQQVERGGLPGLHRRRSSGRPSSLSEAQWRHLLDLLQRGAIAAGFETEQWTLPRIAQVIEQTFGVRYHRHSRGRALHARGWSPQRPLPRATERDEALIAAWLRRDWPRIKKGLAAQGGPWPSWTRSVTRFGPASAPPGHRRATRLSCHE